MIVYDPALNLILYSRSKEDVFIIISSNYIIIAVVASS